MWIADTSTYSLQLLTLQLDLHGLILVTINCVRNYSSVIRTIALRKTQLTLRVAFERLLAPFSETRRQQTSWLPANSPVACPELQILICGVHTTLLSASLYSTTSLVPTAITTFQSPRSGAILEPQFPHWYFVWIKWGCIHSTFTNELGK